MSGCARTARTTWRFSRSARRLLSRAHERPEIRVLPDEAVRVHREIPHEPSAAALVAEARLVEARVHLFEPFEREAREAQPRRAHGGRLAHAEPEATDRQRVRGRAEPQVDVHAAVELRPLQAV